MLVKGATAKHFTAAKDRKVPLTEGFVLTLTKLVNTEHISFGNGLLPVQHQALLTPLLTPYIEFHTKE